MTLTIRNQVKRLKSGRRNAAHTAKIALCPIAVWRTLDSMVIYVADAENVSWDEDL